MISTEISAMKPYRITVAIACHNRKNTTRQCLDSLFDQTLSEKIILNVIVVDDGSQDRTSDLIKENYPHVCLLQGKGDLYWNGAMLLALKEAQKTSPDFHFWLNDDVILYPNALQTLIKTYEKILRNTGVNSIIVGTFCTPKTKTRSYGGQKRSNKWHPLKFKPVYTEGKAMPCHTFQGNGVLVPAAVIKKIGIIDSHFSGCQNIGDTDYGLRATRQGITIYSSPSFVGECELNTDVPLWQSPDATIKQRWDDIMSPKGLQAGNYLFYARRHGGTLWPLFWLYSMLKALVVLLFPGFKSSTSKT